MGSFQPRLLQVGYSLLLVSIPKLCSNPPIKTRKQRQTLYAGINPTTLVQREVRTPFRR